MAKSQKELNHDLKKLSPVVKELHLDIVDGKFANNKSLHFNFKIKNSFLYNAHLMVNNPKIWVEKCLKKKIKTIIFHPEVIAEQEIIELIGKIKSKKRKVGLALKPKTKVKTIKNYLPFLDYVLILTVEPGFYGAKFKSAPLRKIKKIKKINPYVKIIVDGGMDPKTIKKAAKYPVNYFVSGSYTTKADFPKKSIKSLLDAIKQKRK